MTSTHYCESCEKKTTHITGDVRVGDRLVDAIRCVVCLTIVQIKIVKDTP